MRTRFVVPASLIVVLALAVGACAAPEDGAGRPGPAAPAPAATAPDGGGAQPGPAGRPPPGIVPAARREPAPALRVTAFDGRTVTLADFRGRPVVMNFFESWCSICQAEQPDLSRVAGQFARRVGFVGVSYHDTVAAGRAYQRRFAISYPLANDPSGRTWARWHVSYQPVTVLVDKQGRIAERFDGGTTGGTLAAALTYLAAE
jgi:cytochrome c biogenesis protein CcmG/thiol:disulfide interchange protein DsbE